MIRLLAINLKPLTKDRRLDLLSQVPAEELQDDSEE
jgi:hypothetical protein